MRCNWCNEEVGGKDELLTHTLTVHAPKSSSSRESAQTVKKHHTPKPKTTSREVLRCVKSVIGALNCSTCKREFKYKRDLLRHERDTHSNKTYVCVKCKSVFKNQRTLRQHQRRAHQLRCKECRLVCDTVIELYKHKRREHQCKKVCCVHCGRCFRIPKSLRLHAMMCAARKAKFNRFQRARALRFNGSRVQDNEVSDGGEWVEEQAMHGDARIHKLVITDKNDLQLTLLQNQEDIHHILTKDVKDLSRIKWYLTASILYHTDKDGESSLLRYMRCSPLTTLREDELREQFQQAILGVINSFDKCQSEGSQILFECVEQLEIRVAKYSPFKGSSYLPLPKKFQNIMKGLVNIQNFDDEKCFLYCCLAAVDLPESHPERVSNYRERLQEFNLKGIKFPVSITDISKFEEQNPGHSINVFGLEDDEEVIPIRASKVKDGVVINLLLLQGEDEENEQHYVLIKNLSHFLGHKMKQKRKLFWCENCLSPLYSKEKYQEHKPLCLENKPQVVKMPKARDLLMRFQQFGHQMHHDYVVYADFESIVVPLNVPLPDPNKSSTTKNSKHVPCGFSYIIVNADGSLLKEPVLVHGEDNLVERFLLCLKEEAKYITELRGEMYEIDMSEDQEREFQQASKCYLCGDDLPRPGVKKVRDHDWRKPQQNFRGAACQYPCTALGRQPACAAWWVLAWSSACVEDARVSLSRHLRIHSRRT